MKWGKEKETKTAQLQEGSLHKSVVVTPTALLEKLTASRALVINVVHWPLVASEATTGQRAPLLSVSGP